MSLTKRVEDLERRIGTADGFLLFIVRFVGCDPEKMGPERAIYREPCGYRDVNGGRTWMPEAGESGLELKARVESELRTEGYKAYAVCECYAEI